MSSNKIALKNCVFLRYPARCNPAFWRNYFVENSQIFRHFLMSDEKLVFLSVLDCKCVRFSVSFLAETDAVDNLLLGTFLPHWYLLRSSQRTWHGLLVMGSFFTSFTYVCNLLPHSLGYGSHVTRISRDQRTGWFSFQGTRLWLSASGATEAWNEKSRHTPILLHVEQVYTGLYSDIRGGLSFR